MQERNVLILVVVLVAATAGAGVVVNALRSNNGSSFEAFYLTAGVQGTPAVGANLTITVRVQQAFIDSRTLPSLFLSVDMGTLQVHAATLGTNPWGSPTVWNLTGVDLSSAIEFTITASPTTTGPMTVYAMVWVPLGSLGSVTVDASGHVNPAGINLMASSSVPIDVTAAA